MSTFIPKLPPSYNNLELNNSIQKECFKNNKLKNNKKITKNESLKIVITLLIILLILSSYYYSDNILKWFNMG